ncbi:neurofascin-like, partial [Saccoglossus kowalevskii]
TSPPSITEEPEAYYIVDPRVNAQLKCVARGNPTPTYVWKKNGRDVELTDRVTMTDGTLVIEEPHERLDDGTYQCYANNNYGTALSNKITLRVG